MFEKICIKSNRGNDQKIDIASLIDTMLFYGEVNVLVYEKELTALLEAFGVDLLAELIQMGRIKLHIRQKLFGAANPKDNSKHIYGFGFFNKQEDSIEGILYRAHRAHIKDSTRNNMFAARFSYIVSPLTQETTEIMDFIKEDLKNQEYLKSATSAYLGYYFPEYSQQEELEIQIEETTQSGFPFDSFCIHSNLNEKELTNIIHKQGFNGPFYYSGLLLALGESRSDNCTAGLFESELITNDSYSKLIALQLSDSIKKALKGQEQINLFQDNILYGCPRLGEAFLTHAISSRQLKELLEEGDKWRYWLQKQSEDSNIISEYVEELSKKTLADNTIIKGSRMAVTSLIGFIPIVGATLEKTASIIDTFFVDKLLRGWKPNHFIQNKLKSTLQQASR